MKFRMMQGLGWCAAAVALFVATGAVEACPMCAETVAADDNLPRAYMFSILFMLSMPAIVFTGIGAVIYRAIKRHEAAAANMPTPEMALEHALPKGMA